MGQHWSQIHDIVEAIVAIGAILYASYRVVGYVIHATEFIRVLGSNHIPHIYMRLDRIDDKLRLPRTINIPENVIPSAEEKELSAGQ